MGFRTKNIDTDSQIKMLLLGHSRETSTSSSVNNNHDDIRRLKIKHDFNMVTGILKIDQRIQTAWIEIRNPRFQPMTILQQLQTLNNEEEQSDNNTTTTTIISTTIRDQKCMTLVNFETFHFPSLYGMKTCVHGAFHSLIGDGPHACLFLLDVKRPDLSYIIKGGYVFTDYNPIFHEKKKDNHHEVCVFVGNDKSILLRKQQQQPNKSLFGNNLYFFTYLVFGDHGDRLFHVAVENDFDTVIDFTNESVYSIIWPVDIQEWLLEQSLCLIEEQQKSELLRMKKNIKGQIGFFHVQLESKHDDDDHPSPSPSASSSQTTNNNNENFIEQFCQLTTTTRMKIVKTSLEEHYHHKYYTYHLFHSIRKKRNSFDDDDDSNNNHSSYEHQCFACQHHHQNGDDEDIAFKRQIEQNKKDFVGTGSHNNNNKKSILMRMSLRRKKSKKSSFKQTDNHQKHFYSSSSPSASSSSSSNADNHQSTSFWLYDKALKIEVQQQEQHDHCMKTKAYSVVHQWSSTTANNNQKIFTFWTMPDQKMIEETSKRIFYTLLKKILFESTKDKSQFPKIVCFLHTGSSVLDYSPFKQVTIQCGAFVPPFIEKLHHQFIEF